MSGYAILASRHAPHLVMFGVEPSMTESTYVRDKVAALDAELAPLNLSFAAARKLGQKAVGWTERAEAAIKAHPDTLLGPATYEMPRGHVKWHLDYIAKRKFFEGALGPDKIAYDKSEDLKKWVSACYRIMVAADQDSALRDSIRDELRSDLIDAVVSAPGRAADMALAAPGKVVESATGLPLWAWSLLAVGGVGLLGYGVVKILSAIAPAVAPAVAPAIVGIGVEEFQRRRRQAESQV